MENDPKEGSGSLVVNWSGQSAGQVGDTSLLERMHLFTAQRVMRLKHQQ